MHQTLVGLAHATLPDGVGTALNAGRAAVLVAAMVRQGKHRASAAAAASAASNAQCARMLTLT